MGYKNLQYSRVKDLIKNSNVFNGDSGGGKFGNRNYDFVLSDYNNNLYGPVKEDILDYFEKNKISWWKGKLTNHTLSSQVSCLNHLFPIRKNKGAVLAMINNLYTDIIDVLLIPTDQHKPGYIQFEAISDFDNLNENYSTRGRNCTSIDALIYGKHKDGRKILFVIEWKYVEMYGNEDKATGDRGKKRKQRYTNIINDSQQLKIENHKAFYYEPFYQLMRQTIWVEQMIAHNNVETIKADDFFHIHVIPKENKELLNKKYVCSGKRMEETWRSLIKDQKKYLIITPEDLFEPINSYVDYGPLLDYLETRYW